MKLLFVSGLVSAALAASPIESCPASAASSSVSDVRNLRPGDIQVMGAMGDSITAGFALNSLPLESRGESWAIGDNKDAQTLYNFVKHYNPNVIGGAKYDIAVTGDVVSGMDSQAQRLVRAWSKDKSIDMENDWKMVNLWIGANNMCPSCEGGKANQPPAYEAEMTKALDYMEENMPRTLVNVMATLPLSSLVNTKGANTTCVAQHLITRVECPCAFVAPEKLDEVVLADADILESLANKYTAKKNPGFAVVYQPGLKESVIPDVDYLSKLDCFHPSLLGHQLVAQIAWSNLFEDVGKKSTKFPGFPWDIYCPTTTDVVRT